MIAEDYAAAREAAALVALDERGVLAATGPQRQKLLHAVLSNDVEGRAPGQGCRAALMTPRGHLLAIVRILVTGDSVLLELPADRLRVVEATLEHYRVASPVRFAARPTALVGLLGPAARDALARCGAERPDLSPESHAVVSVSGHEVRLVRAGDLPCGGYVLHVAPDALAGVRVALEAAGARAIGRPALDALRIESGRAWYGPDVTEENLLHETGLLRECHSASKGCYVGQEVVARLEARGGHVNKALRGLRLGAPAQAGTPIAVAAREVGRVTTAAVSPRLGPIALGYVHRSHYEPGTAVEVAGAPATVVALPMV